MTASAKDNRRQRRQMAKAGVALLDRVSIESGALAASVTQGVDLVELVAFHVAEALARLDAQGGDVLAHTVVTIGAHPEAPGALTIEAKVARMKPTSPRHDDAAFPPCDCGSVDKYGDDIGEHGPTCPYHLAAVERFGPLPEP